MFGENEEAGRLAVTEFTRVEDMVMKTQELHVMTINVSTVATMGPKL